MNRTHTVTDNSTALLPEPTLRRLPWYLAYVDLLQQAGVTNVSSRSLARDIDVDAAQIAKDLSFINVKGKTRIGYDVAELKNALLSHLGFASRHNAVLVGAGSLGAALMCDSGLQHYGLNIVAGVDSNPDLIGKEINGITVYAPSEIRRIVEMLNVKIGVIAVPVDAAQDVADSLIRAGIKGLWNFTPRRIKVSDSIVVANTSIYSHLAVMYNRLANTEAAS